MTFLGTPEIHFVTADAPGTFLNCLSIMKKNYNQRVGPQLVIGIFDAYRKHSYIP
jgi:hypothetical protein